ncbi:nucleoside deaminase [Niveibacterium sp. SC-1]|uniref:nucleoside deaminase n=1 Tax=Niveibacterium sp. SC-1 TaxID=3135646 RepID=UPI00311F8CEE
MPSEETLMRLAIQASRDALAAGDRPFGAVLADREGKVLYVARNTQFSGRDGLAHAEVQLVREAEAALGADSLRGATVYASGEPCAMCSGALFWAGVARIVFAARTSTITRLIGGPSLPIQTAQVYVGANPAPRVEGPLLEEEAAVVLAQWPFGT